MSEETEKCCLTCANLQFGFSSDSFHSWDICDYVCHLEDGRGGYIETKLLCVHGLSDAQIKRKLRKMGRNCKNWRKRHE